MSMNTFQFSGSDSNPFPFPTTLQYAEEHPEYLVALDKRCPGAGEHLRHELRLWQERGRPCLEVWRKLKETIEPGCPSLF